MNKKENNFDLIEKSLVERAKSGEDSALEKIFSYFKNYISKLASNYFLLGAEKEDLIQEGMIGLFKAIRDFDSGIGLSFDSFASVCIKRQMQTALKNASRKKHSPLNFSLSLNSIQFEEDEKELIDFLENSNSLNPEEIFIINETAKNVRKVLYASLSKFEFEVLTLQSQGMSYKEISDITGKSLKSIDNAIQRVNKKINIIKQDMSQ